MQTAMGCRGDRPQTRLTHMTRLRSQSVGSRKFSSPRRLAKKGDGFASVGETDLAVLQVKDPDFGAIVRLRLE